MQRISATIPKELLKEFDKINKQLKEKRSSALRKAIREFIANYKWLSEEKGEKTGAILITYEPEKKEVLTEVQHSFGNLITATMHIHLSEENCLEIIAVNGNVKEIKKLAENLSREVLSVKVVYS